MDGQHGERVEEGRSDGVDDKSISRHICSNQTCWLSISRLTDPRPRPRDVITVNKDDHEAKIPPPPKKINELINKPINPVRDPG